MVASQTVGMIGIGQLGLPVAANLTQAGFTLVGFRRSDRQGFIDLGGKALESPEQVAREAQILLLCLPDEGASLQVAERILPELGPGKIVIEMGTYRKAFKLEQAARVTEAGAQALEAEVSGSPPMVKARKAALYVGGDAQVLEQCRPVLEAISPAVFHLGEYGSAVSMKLIANYLVAVHTLAAAEAMNLGARAGFDPGLVAKVIQQGAGGSAMFGIRAPMMADRAFTPAPGPFTTLEKYLELGRSMADELGSATPLFSVAEAYYERALGNDMRNEDISALIKLLEADSKQA
jgi:3-hydroxyisobutyrate dehydrogenase-like beta-hydroxyacid dehydrogenase